MENISIYVTMAHGSGIGSLSEPMEIGWVFLVIGMVDGNGLW